MSDKYPHATKLNDLRREETVDAFLERAMKVIDEVAELYMRSGCTGTPCTYIPPRRGGSAADSADDLRNHLKLMGLGNYKVSPGTSSVCVSW